MFRSRHHKRRSSVKLPRIPEDEDVVDFDEDSIYHSEATNAGLLLERLYELKLERDNLELRHKRIKCRYSEATYLHLKISTALQVFSTFPLSFEDPTRNLEHREADEVHLNKSLQLIYEKYDEKFQKASEKTWLRGGRGIDLLNRMKKPLQEALQAVESLVINGRL